MQLHVQEENLAFLLQQRISGEGKITIPDRVRGLLFQDPESPENRYVWNHDKEDNYLIVSNESLREKQSSALHISPVEESNPRRTTIPAKVRKEFSLKEGDDLYFVSPEAVKDGIPTAFVWTFEQIEEIILGGAVAVESGFPRKPHF